MDDNKAAPPVRRLRRTPAASRTALLASAQRLLTAEGPTAVTLKAVAQASGMTHGNVTHHFGTSAALHRALVAQIAGDLARDAAAAVLRLRRREIGAEEVVDLVFRALAAGGCGRLIGWLAATGRQAELAPIFAALRASVGDFRAGEPAATVAAAAGAGPIALALLSHALTASLIGEPLEAAAGLAPGGLRKLAADQLRRLRATP